MKITKEILDKRIAELDTKGRELAQQAAEKVFEPFRAAILELQRLKELLEAE